MWSLIIVLYLLGYMIAFGYYVSMSDRIGNLIISPPTPWWLRIIGAMFLALVSWIAIGIYLRRTLEIHKYFVMKDMDESYP